MCLNQMNTYKIIKVEKQTMKFFYSKLKIKKYIYGGEKVVGFETNDIIVKDCSELGFNDIKFSYAYSGNNI